MYDKSLDFFVSNIFLGLHVNNILIFTPFWTVYCVTFEVIGYSRKVLWARNSRSTLPFGTVTKWFWHSANCTFQAFFPHCKSFFYGSLIHLRVKTMCSIDVPQNSQVLHGKFTIPMSLNLNKCQCLSEAESDFFSSVILSTLPVSTVSSVFISWPRDGLFRALLKIECPPSLLSVIRLFHTDMKGVVQFDGSSSKAFGICRGIKQSCLLAPTLFGIFFAIMLRQGFEDSTDTRSDGKLINLSRLRANIKVFHN